MSFKTGFLEHLYTFHGLGLMEGCVVLTDTETIADLLLSLMFSVFVQKAQLSGTEDFGLCYLKRGLWSGNTDFWEVVGNSGLCSKPLDQNLNFQQVSGDSWEHLSLEAWL